MRSALRGDFTNSSSTRPFFFFFFFLWFPNVSELDTSRIIGISGRVIELTSGRRLPLRCRLAGGINKTRNEPTSNCQRKLRLLGSSKALERVTRRGPRHARGYRVIVAVFGTLLPSLEGLLRLLSLSVYLYVCVLEKD